MQCRVPVSFSPASKQIARKVKTRRNTLKKPLKNTWSIVYISQDLLVLVQLYWVVPAAEPLNMSKTRDSCCWTQVTHVWCSMKFHWCVYLLANQRLSLFQNDLEAIWILTLKLYEYWPWIWRAGRQAIHRWWFESWWSLTESAPVPDGETTNWNHIKVMHHRWEIGQLRSGQVLQIGLRLAIALADARPVMSITLK